MIRVARSGITIGPVFVRLSRRYLSSWGYEAVRIGGLRLWSRWNSGGRMLASYHPRSSLTWHWSVSLIRSPKMWSADARRWRAALWFAGNPHAPRPRWWHRFIRRDARRVGSWKDHYRLPFGWSVFVCQQDYHKARGA